MKIRTAVVSGLFLLSWSLTVTAGDIYQWKDAKKERVFSDRPAPNAERVNIPSKPTNPQAVEQRAEANREQREKIETLQEKQKSDAVVTKTVEQDMAKIAAERCEKAQKDYKIATESQRLYRIGKNNEREYLSDAELTTARIDARKALDDACKGKHPQAR